MPCSSMAIFAQQRSSPPAGLADRSKREPAPKKILLSETNRVPKNCVIGCGGYVPIRSYLRGVLSLIERFTSCSVARGGRRMTILFVSAAFRNAAETRLGEHQVYRRYL